MRLRNLLRPGWLGLTALVIVFATACFTLLAPWQFDRHEARKTQNDEITFSRTAPTVAWQPGIKEWRLVSATGEFLQSEEVIARLRTVQGEPAFEVTVPFRLTDGRVVLVDRGFLRPEQSRLPGYQAPPTGQVQLLARQRVDETDSENRDAFTDEDGKRQAWAVDSRTVARATGLRIEPGYLQLEKDSPGVLGPLPLPELDAGPYFSYALQWIAFGAMAILGWLYFTWRELLPGGALSTERPRKRSVAEMVAEEEAAERAKATT
ncbi:SURF1 family cytochrome oxidase biogenesis protein [Kibdelosporangium persicum]|uniref:SURF1-like protein n=1 Tax=Kibdelosporangium persicum TaxID=2698649 RepID=A0ABX2FCF5_9PSEU|nr:SURF1 family cytochrome oxidase biogenesis protein [Kibdelosporangium persicum]NRN69055.1 Cytochrome oxidase assembly protein ShyY1 [Kibdelosporangium persicum]